MRSTGFWTVAVAFFATMSYTTVPTPLYPLYQQRDGFSGRSSAGSSRSTCRTR